MTYFPPDIIDNTTTIFAEALEQTILKAEQRKLDIATGYFAPEVWRIVGNAFAELHAFRLLLGERPDVPMGGAETVDLRRYYRAKIADDLARLAFDRKHAERVDALLAFPANPRAVGLELLGVYFRWRGAAGKRGNILATAGLCGDAGLWADGDDFAGERESSVSHRKGIDWEGDARNGN